jgi:hypothetical protein
MKRTIVAAGLLALLIGAAAAQSPQRSHAGAPDGKAAPFEGEWAAFRPGGEDDTLIICPAPIAIHAIDDARVEYGTLSATPTPFDLAATDGRTTWTGPGEAAIAIWIEPDEFHMVPLADGEPVWGEVLVYHRCPVLPRESYAGAPDGLAAPFEGHWSMESPSTTANRPNDVLASCDAPATIRPAGEKAILFVNPEGEESTIGVSIHDGHTDWALSDTPYPWDIVWVDPDRFHGHMIGIDLTTEWRQAFVFIRCPG